MRSRLANTEFKFLERLKYQTTKPFTPKTFELLFANKNASSISFHRDLLEPLGVRNGQDLELRLKKPDPVAPIYIKIRNALFEAAIAGAAQSAKRTPTLGIVEQCMHRIAPQSIAAYDACNKINLACLGYQADYLAFDEMSRVVEGHAMEISKSCSSPEAFCMSILVGAVLESSHAQCAFLQERLTIAATSRSSALRLIKWHPF
jgi:hypothetical protein